MNSKLFISFLIFISAVYILEIDSRKVTQKPKAPPTPPKKDKSWVRKKIDSAKEKYNSGKEKLKSKFSSFGKSDNTKISKTTTTRKPAPKNNFEDSKSRIGNIQTTRRIIGWNANSNLDNSNVQLMTTKKPFFEKMKEKAKGSEKYIGKAVGWAKMDLGIGVEGPKKPSKILKFGKKAAEYVFRKKSQRPSIPHHSPSSSIGYQASQNQQISNFENPENKDLHNPKYHEKVEFLKNRLERMQNAIQENWNSSEAGTKYKIFEEKKNWDDAQVHCEELGSHLAYLDSESKNNFARSLLNFENVTMTWFGLRTEVTGIEKIGNVEMCGTVEKNGTWNIQNCELELPYLCQSFRFDVLVEIPSNF